MLSSLFGFTRWLNALLPALRGLYAATQGDQKEAIRLIKASYQAADAEQVKDFYGDKP